jgi:rubrerythrin
MKDRNIQTEVDASYLYQRLAENEPDEVLANVYGRMSEIEKGHALVLMKSRQPETFPLQGRKY